MDDVNEMLRALGPYSGDHAYSLAWNLTLYWMFFVNIIILLVDDTAFGTNISLAVLLSIVIDKVFAFGYMIDPGRYTPEYCHTKIFIGTYLIRVIMFAGPFMLAGQTTRGAVRAIAVLSGLSGVIYMLARWYYEQREVNAANITCAVQSAGLLLLLARLTLRNKLSLDIIHWHVPVAVTRHFAAHDVEIELA